MNMVVHTRTSAFGVAGSTETSLSRFLDSLASVYSENVLLKSAQISNTPFSVASAIGGDGGGDSIGRALDCGGGAVSLGESAIVVVVAVEPQAGSRPKSAFADRCICFLLELQQHPL